MNIKTINIKNRTQSLKELENFKNKNYGRVDIKIENLHLNQLNELLGKRIFKKNDAYISAETLWELMQPIGQKKQHNYHGFSPSNILEIFLSLTKPYCILKTHLSRFTIISSIMLNKTRLLTIVEINATLSKNRAARINKIVTIYPKDHIDQYIGKRTILYLK